MDCLVLVFLCEKKLVGKLPLSPIKQYVNTNNCSLSVTTLFYDNGNGNGNDVLSSQIKSFHLKTSIYFENVLL